MKYPQEPKQWNDANYTLWKDFEFNSTPDIECLIRLVKENIEDRGNSSYLRARLLGILYSKFSKANEMFWLRHYHPKTWKMRLAYSRFKKKLHRLFKTKTFRGQVYLCNIAHEVIEKRKKKDKI